MGRRKNVRWAVMEHRRRERLIVFKRVGRRLWAVRRHPRRVEGKRGRVARDARERLKWAVQMAAPGHDRKPTRRWTMAQMGLPNTGRQWRKLRKGMARAERQAVAQRRA